MKSADIQSVYDVIDYLFDKMNIRVEMTETQIVSFVSDFSRKLITWTIISDIIKILIVSAVLVVSTVILKKVKEKIKDKIKLKHSMEETLQVWEPNLKSILNMIEVLIYILCIIILGTHIFELVECLVFPEKIIAEFISNYL